MSAVRIDYGVMREGSRKLRWIITEYVHPGGTGVHTHRVCTRCNTEEEANALADSLNKAAPKGVCESCERVEQMTRRRETKDA